MEEVKDVLLEDTSDLEQNKVAQQEKDRRHGLQRSTQTNSLFPAERLESVEQHRFSPVKQKSRGNASALLLYTSFIST